MSQSQSRSVGSRAQGCERVVYPVHPHILILTEGLAGFGQVAHIFHYAACSWLKMYPFAFHLCPSLFAQGHACVHLRI